MAERLLAAVLTVWTAVTLLCQVPGPLSRRLRALDACSLIPSWLLFAPHPPRHDYVLVRRTGRPPELTAPWTRIRWCTPVPNGLAPLLNPARRETKVLLDSVGELLATASGPGRVARPPRLASPSTWR
ncbi:hypothetical protein [Dactylosporangium sp. NPDC051541]|uniref:hypothetical protein n=1 Tax=Dactylosporangium sp. NPDC051541 TaxID=3363977 RepID=UPI0037B6573C